MNKKIILLAACFFMAATALATSTGTTMEDLMDVQIRKEDEHVNTGRPHAPARILFNGELNTDMGVLFVYSTYDVGEVAALIENFTTGEYFEYSFDSYETAILPISCTEGFWKITLTLDTSDVYVGEFEL